MDPNAEGAYRPPDAPLNPAEEDLLTTLSKTAHSAVEATTAGAGAAGEGVLSVVNAASDKMAIAKYLTALEEERKNTLGVLTVRLGRRCYVLGVFWPCPLANEPISRHLSPSLAGFSFVLFFGCLLAAL